MYKVTVKNTLIQLEMHTFKGVVSAIEHFTEMGYKVKATYNRRWLHERG